MDAAVPPPRDEEVDLIEASRAGSREAFTRLVQRHHGAVRSYIGSYVDSAELANDLAQETFISALQSLATYRGDATLRAWLLGIARHRALEHLRATQRRAVRERREVEAMLIRRRAEMVERDAERLVDRGREMTALGECLKTLAGRAAGLVEAHYDRGRRLADIARERGENEDSLRVELLRIRRTLRRCIEGRLAAGALP